MASRLHGDGSAVHDDPVAGGGAADGGDTPVLVVAGKATTHRGPRDGDDSDKDKLLDSSRHGSLAIPNATPRAMSLGHMFGLFAVFFGYSFVFNTVNNLVIPKEVERLSGSKQGIWVGLIMASGALSQLATPVVGAWSDRSGQRTPYLVYGALITIGGIIMFLIVNTVAEIASLFVAFVLTSVGLSVQYSMSTALLNDHVAEEHVGKGSGVIAILCTIGSGCGYAMFAFAVPLYYSYLCYIFATGLCVGITLAFLPSAVEAGGRITGAVMAPTTTAAAPSAGGPSTPAIGTSAIAPAAPGGTSCVCRVLSDLAAGLTFPNPRRHPDFFFACLSRALFNTGLAGQVYLVYYFRDTLKAENPTQVASTVAVAALFGGMVAGLPSGVLSDRVGKKPVIYLAVAVCIGTLIAFMTATRIATMQLVGFAYGIGNVAYLSVDYALGVQSLPRRPSDGGSDADDDHRSVALGAHHHGRGLPIDAAKDLGVFSMSATIGQLFGQVLYGSLLEQFAMTTPSGTVLYSHHGFTVIYTVGATCFGLAGLSAKFIRSVK